MSNAKNPTFLSPKWFWATTVVTATVFTPAFWKRWATPEHQATWTVSSWTTLAQVTGGVAAWQWAQVNAPWAVSAVTWVGNGVKAVTTFVATLAVAAWNVMSP